MKTDTPKTSQELKLPLGIRINKRTALVIGLGSTALGIFGGELYGATACVGGFLIAWGLKPKEERPYRYETVRARVYDDGEVKLDVPASQTRPIPDEAE